MSIDSESFTKSLPDGELLYDWHRGLCARRLGPNLNSDELLVRRLVQAGTASRQ
ncbi:14404_t:CDS:2 [Rhizophagus irregularis]|nr:14404_t:CDS:2 [Rhizophagus irregularis]